MEQVKLNFNMSHKFFLICDSPASNPASASRVLALASRVLASLTSLVDRDKERRLNCVDRDKDRRLNCVDRDKERRLNCLDRDKERRLNCVDRDKERDV